MQTSGTFPQLSDGMKKTMTGCAPPKVAKPEPKPKPSTHRSGGHAKHAARKR